MDKARIGTLAVALAAACALPAAAQAQPLAPRPNVILIVADDLGWGDLAIYGHPDVATPNIDALARRGMLFTSYYQGSPVCSPSRATMLTGRFAAETGIHYAIGGAAGRRYNNPQWLDPDLPTLYDAFRSAGYATGHFGKWHLGDRTSDAPTVRAAEAAPPRRSVSAADAPPPSAYGVDVSAVTNGRGPPLLLDGRRPERAETSEAIVRSGIAFIEQAGSKPFFLSLWTLEPHAVLTPTDAQMKDYLALTSSAARARGWRSSQTVYYASLANIDRQLGLLFDYLETSGRAKDTIVVFTSDNGPSPLWSVATGHAGAGLAGPFRGVKGSLYEGGVRVPFIVSWPGHTPVNIVDATSVIGGVDLLPTLAGLAGIAAPAEGVDGEDRSATMLGKPSARKAPLFWDYRFGSWGRHIDKSPRLAVRDGDWKLLMNPDRSRVELYNLAEDPSETANRAASEPALVARLGAALMRWFRERVRDPANAPATRGSDAYPWPRSGSAPQPRRARARADND